MKYGTITWKFESFKPKKDAKIEINLSGVDGVDRVECKDYTPTNLFWHYPEIYNKEQVLDLFVDAQIKHFTEEIQWYTELIQRMLEAKKEASKNL